ncbi:amidase domain-containing protein [Texcoconibacillus texcoconensis]|uniref:Putative amidase domain-containing protein n=1 Tax=Texcoconibacillus texcoconensis TaxID=1095777 RepID=A0A840QPP7_9BACI|nr:amidase domain-containing protein [Texcoconibacillus texcoconensis]MBB5173345.1 hypothetical protein [Texcoconibacillus texcoconensis]
MGQWVRTLKNYLEGCFQSYIRDDQQSTFFQSEEREALERKKLQLAERDAEIVKNIIGGQVFGVKTHSYGQTIDYGLSLQHLIKQGDFFYIEEHFYDRRAFFYRGKLVDERCLSSDGNYQQTVNRKKQRRMERSRNRYEYNRLEAVKYAERWWNDYNPQYQRFEDNCTNFISQCLYAGGAPMTGYPDRAKGWWYKGNQWSFSWAVTHSFRWYLSGSESGLQAHEVESPKQLQRGDVILYDFDGNGRWQHATIVVAFDQQGMPLVNAHTVNSRMRYWKYEDSTAWTPNIQYKFFHIISG